MDCAISAVNLAEIIDRLCRLDGAPSKRSRCSSSRYLGKHLTVRPATEETAWRAGAIRAPFHSKRALLSLGDSFLSQAPSPATSWRPRIRLWRATAKELGLGLRAAAEFERAVTGLTISQPQYGDSVRFDGSENRGGSSQLNRLRRGFVH